MAGDGNCNCGFSDSIIDCKVCSCKDSNSAKNASVSSQSDNRICIVSPDLHAQNLKVKEEITCGEMPVRTGSAVFVEELKSRDFANAEEILLHLDPQTLTVDYFKENGFDVPIMFSSSTGLGLQMPPSNISFTDIESLIGPDVEIEVINVAKQSDEIMKLSEFIKYMMKPKRTRVLNVLSLEFSDTRLGELVQPPTIAEKIDWVNLYWPDELSHPLSACRPKVQKYCLMAPKGAYTDFHVDFGGSSVWYHVLRGEKVFYLIEPTDANLALYDNWMESKTRLNTFFADQVERCYKLSVKEGATILLPSGWIHAVLTPEDTLVFGGNFLHSFNVELQLRIYEIEKSQEVEERFLFPQFKMLNWLAAYHLNKDLASINRTRSIAPTYLLKGLKALWFTFKQWKIVPTFPDDLPGGGDEFNLNEINVDNLLKEVSKEVKKAQKLIITLDPPKPIRESTRVKKKTLFKDFIEYNSDEDDPTKFFNPTNSANPNDIRNKEQQQFLKLTLPNPTTYPYLNISKVGYKNGNSSEDDANVSHSTNAHDNLTNYNANLYYSSEFINSNSKINNSSINLCNESPTMLLGTSPINNKTTSNYYNKTSDNIMHQHEATTIEANDPKNWKIRVDDRKIFITKDKTEESSASATMTGFEKFLPDCDHDSTYSESSNGDNSLIIDDQSIATIKETEELSLTSSVASSYLASNRYGAHDGLSTFKPIKELKVILNDVMDVGIPCCSSSLEMPRINLPKRNIEESLEDSEASELDLHEVHQDDDFIYPSIYTSSDEDEIQTHHKKKDDLAWSPRSKVSCAVKKMNRPIRVGTMKKAVEKGLEAAKMKNVTATVNANILSKKNKMLKADNNCDSSTKQSTKSAKKPRKGFATPKQRLGKILKLHKLIN